MHWCIRVGFWIWKSPQRDVQLTQQVPVRKAWEWSSKTPTLPRNAGSHRRVAGETTTNSCSRTSSTVLVFPSFIFRLDVAAHARSQSASVYRKSKPPNRPPSDSVSCRAATGEEEAPGWTCEPTVFKREMKREIKKKQNIIHWRFVPVTCFHFKTYSINI